MLLALACAACGPAIAMNPAGGEISAARLAAFPSSGVEWEFDYDGNKTEKPLWTLAARMHVDAEIHVAASMRGVRFFPEKSLANLEGYPEFLRWSELALVDIKNAGIGRLKDPPRSISEWGYSADLRPWRARLSADHVLITLFVDGHNSPGRSTALAFGGGGWTARHDIVSCAIRLADGRLVWCKVSNILWNIREQKGAQIVVNDLLGKMLDDAAKTAPWPPSVAAPKPPPAPPIAKEPPPPAEPAKPVDQKEDDEEATTARP